MDDANAFAEDFIADYNRRFAKTPRHDFDVHRQLDVDDDLDAIFTWRGTGQPRGIQSQFTQIESPCFSVINNVGKQEGDPNKPVLIFSGKRH